MMTENVCESMRFNTMPAITTRFGRIESALRRQLNVLRKRMNDVKVNSAVAVNELKQLVNRSTRARVSDILFYYITQGSVGAGTRRIKSCAVIVCPTGRDTFILPARYSVTRLPTNNASFFCGQNASALFKPLICNLFSYITTKGLVEIKKLSIQPTRALQTTSYNGLIPSLR